MLIWHVIQNQQQQQQENTFFSLRHYKNKKEPSVVETQHYATTSCKGVRVFRCKRGTALSGAQHSTRNGKSKYRPEAPLTLPSIYECVCLCWVMIIISFFFSLFQSPLSTRKRRNCAARKAILALLDMGMGEM